MIQTQFAHMITVPDEWEHDGHTFQVTQDDWAECPTERIDSADALCVIGGPHGCILHHPAETDCPAMWEFDNFHEESTPIARKTLLSTISKTICEETTMIENWDTKFCFTADELGVEQGEYDYVTRNCVFRIREDFEAMAAEAVDDLHKPVTVLGRTLKASDIAREMLSDDWEAYVNSCIAHLIAMEEIKEVR